MIYADENNNDTDDMHHLLKHQNYQLLQNTAEILVGIVVNETIHGNKPQKYILLAIL